MKIKQINIGTENEIKVEALKDVLKKYPNLSGASVTACKVDSRVSKQPKSLEETIRGAKQRAKSAFFSCDLSFGIEDGLMAVPETKTGYMNVCVCAAYDVEKYYLGFSSAFEYPEKIVKMIVAEGLDVNQAFYESGLAKDKKIGSGIGAIGILTKGRWKRSDTVKQAITAALIAIENEELYGLS
jgi:inosine/xanthosine triphosphatase